MYQVTGFETRPVVGRGNVVVMRSMLVSERCITELNGQVCVGGVALNNVTIDKNPDKGLIDLLNRIESFKDELNCTDAGLGHLYMMRVNQLSREDFAAFAVEAAKLYYRMKG